MLSRKCRILPLIGESGPHQMAADEAMLATVATTGIASLRFYRWSEPTVSLGYFQYHSVRLDNPHLAALPWVRRATGGATLVHDQELTYALAIPSTDDWQPRGISWIKRFHGIIVDTLASLNIDTKICGDDAEKKLGDILCFLHQTPGDVLCGSSKVVGSAQRKQRGALLQHGGILLAQSRNTPQLPGLLELTGRELSINELTSAITAQFIQESACQACDADWSNEEQSRIKELMLSRYLNPAWNEKR